MVCFWDKDPRHRPKMSAVLDTLRGSSVYLLSRRPPPHWCLSSTSPVENTSSCFPREEIINEILDLADQTASVALFGSIGVGKSFVARAVLDHSRTQAKCGENRHFMHCDDLTGSLEDFLERLFDTIHANCPENPTKLRSCLESSPPFVLLLDGVDFILDPLAPESEDISATTEEFGSLDHVCIITTSRMDPEIRGFHRVEAPVPSEIDARETFYNLCNLPRSSTVYSHPLSIEHLASSVRKLG